MKRLMRIWRELASGLRARIPARVEVWLRIRRPTLEVADAAAALARRRAALSLNDWARKSSSLCSPWQPSTNLVQTNFSALMLRHELVERIGSWDTARIADRKFVNRVVRLWRERGFWETRAAAGRTFVAAHCGYDAFTVCPARLKAAS